MNFDELNNPIWVALTTRHAGMARSTGVARRYPSLVSPLAGLREPTRAAFSDLVRLVAPDEHLGLFTAEPLQVPGDWLTIRTRPIEQMICTRLTRGSPSCFLELGRSDIPEMLALTAATEPGPFLPETIQMGRYIGIRSDDGRLIAMAGERLKLNGFTEISGVCTNPEFRGHGHAGALVSLLVAQTLEEGRVPFLHVKAENGAKSLYEKLGFRVRRAIQLTVISPGYCANSSGARTCPTS
jgi:ribosomal protein S18 acetylase RimI-like enzyme